MKAFPAPKCHSVTRSTLIVNLKKGRGEVIILSLGLVGKRTFV